MGQFRQSPPQYNGVPLRLADQFTGPVFICLGGCQWEFRHANISFEILNVRIFTQIPYQHHPVYASHMTLFLP
jgi:hypothetical protein